MRHGPASRCRVQGPANKAWKQMRRIHEAEIDTALFWDTAPPPADVSAAGHVVLATSEDGIPQAGPSPELQPPGTGTASLPKFKDTPAVGTAEDSLLVASTEVASCAEPVAFSTSRVRHCSWSHI